MRRFNYLAFLMDLVILGIFSWAVFEKGRSWGFMLFAFFLMATTGGYHYEEEDNF